MRFRWLHDTNTVQDGVPEEVSIGILTGWGSMWHGLEGAGILRRSTAILALAERGLGCEGTDQKGDGDDLYLRWLQLISLGALPVVSEN